MRLSAARDNAYSALALRYDALMDDYDYSRWCDFYCEIAGLKRGMRVAETACGTGLMTRELIRRGIKVAASDISEQMLQIAGESLRASGSAGNALSLAQMDMRSFKVHRPCDAVISACDGVNYLIEGLENFFSSAHGALKPGGILAFDISSADKLRAMDGQFFYDDRDDETCFWSAAMDSETDILTIDLSVFLRCTGDASRYERHDESQSMKAFEKEEIARLLYKTGFRDINIYGDLSRTDGEAGMDEPVRCEYVADRSSKEDKRLHFTAKKV
ncbi:MAG: class I SAM-dependent DNA methyltransferase [Christensenellales bacterium]|jgi:SAM-dependent methyltransferase